MNVRSSGTKSPAWSESLRAARQGSREALGQLLEACRDYLMLVANEELNCRLRSKGGASDLVQETFVEAQRDFSQFQGATEEELRGWLRQILRHNLANFTRSFCETEMRQVSREVSIDGRAGPTIARQLFEVTPSPCSQVIQVEQAEILDRALTRLSDDYRLAVLLRNRERMTFEQIGKCTNRSADAARKLWARAIETLRRELKELKAV